ncbi:hypothetical protein A3K63_03675, partial [Candidatus Micrarchaeota archaeon RBG_16_49_10]
RQIAPTEWIEVEGELAGNPDGYNVNETITATSVKPAGIRDSDFLKILAFDTEWVDEGGEEKLIMLSMAGNDGFRKVVTSHSWNGSEKYVESVGDERDIIEIFIRSVKERDPDFLVGYGSDGFDIPKIKREEARMKIKLELGRDDQIIHVARRGRISSARTRGRVHIDAFDFVSHILSSGMRSDMMTLDEVAQQLLGADKTGLGDNEMVKMWGSKDDVGRLVEHCMHDSVITLRLGELILPQIFSLCSLTGMLPFDSCRTTYSQLVEAFLMRRAFADDVLIPNRPKTDEIEKRRMDPSYKGALVIQPEKGIHANVLVFDFRSLYPTIIVSHNIDPWTFNKTPCSSRSEVPESGWYFCQDEKGFIPRHLSEIIDARRKIKATMKEPGISEGELRVLENKQYALKIIANALYGYYGYFGSRWYKRECGSSAAAWGRFYITKVIDMARLEGFKIIYGDTDSLMARLEKDLPQDELVGFAMKFADSVNKSLPGIIELEFRELYEGGIFVARKLGEEGAKKRYALIDGKGNLEVRGFETVRRDWCELSKAVQREVLTIILRDKDPAKAVQLVRETVRKIRDGKASLGELTILEQITRPLSQYEQIGPHVRAAQKAAAMGRPVFEGMVIGFVVTKGTGSISDRAEPVENVRPNQYDPEYYVKHQIVPASMRVLKALGYSEQQVLGGRVQKGLEGFLKRPEKI